MAFLNRPTPEDADMVEFAGAVRAALVVPPPPSLEATLVPHLAEEARIAHTQRPTEPRAARPAAGRSRLRTVGQLALGFCLVPLVAAGLATAGVKLPGPAQDAFESVGINLPNQDSGDSGDQPAPATETGDPATTTPGGEAAPPNGKANGQGKAKGHGKAKGRGQGKGQGQATAPGQTGAAGSNGNGNANGQGNGNAGGNGKSQGGSSSSGSSSTAPGHSKSTGSNSANGNAVGQGDAAPPGQANKPEAPGSSAQAPGQAK